MAEDTRPDMQDDARRVHGARGVGALIPKIARPAFRRRSPAAAQIMADWAAIVGPALAAATTPRRLSGGRLAIACAGPVAMELQHLAPQLIARINAHLGQAVVSELRFTQDHAPPPPSHPPPPRAVPPQALAAVTERLAGLPEGPLRDALAALGHSVLATPTAGTRKHSTPRPSRD